MGFPVSRRDLSIERLPATATAPGVEMLRDAEENLCL